jgi:hypothetical protein
MGFARNASAAKMPLLSGSSKHQFVFVNENPGLAVIVPTFPVTV